LRNFLFIALLVPGLASAAIVWKGDFETGNLSQWTRAQTVSSDRLQVVSDVVHEGGYALKATVRQGDNPIQASGNRNEILYVTREEPGSEYFYKWSTLFPEGYPSVDSWQVFAQWHQDGCCGSPPLEFYVVGEKMFLRVGGSGGRVLWSSPLVRGRWNDFVLHVKWSSDPSQGFVEMYKDGELAVPLTMAATQFGGDRNYLKLGLYRDSSISQVGVVYHDGFTMGTHLHDVMPPAPAPVVEAPPQPAPPAAQLPVPVPAPATAPPPTGTTSPPAPIESPQTRTPTPGGTQPGDIEYGQAPQGCGASTSGGMPVVAAAALLVMALFTRRRHALARSRARSR
jgi:uncharacterized protein (TIGR03382 family)